VSGLKQCSILIKLKERLLLFNIYRNIYMKVIIKVSRKKIENNNVLLIFKNKQKIYELLRESKHVLGIPNFYLFYFLSFIL